MIEFFMAHELGQEKSTYINMPLDELRTIYANYEHLLAINKTSHQAHEDETAGERVPEEAMNRIKGLEATVTKLSTDMEIMRQDHARQYKEFIEQLRRLTQEGKPVFSDAEHTD